MTSSLKADLSTGLSISLVLVFLAIWFFASTSIRELGERYVASRLRHDSETLLTAISFKPDGSVSLDEQRVDAIYRRPFSGHYFLIETAGGSIRSRSLWDHKLSLAQEPRPAPGPFHLPGPQQQTLLVLSSPYSSQGQKLVITVSEDLAEVENALAGFQNRFGLAAVLALVLLVLIQLTIVRRALRPLQRARAELRALEHGELRQLNDRVAAEVRPLILEVNRLLEILAHRLTRSRDALGNLTHALKRPLTVIRQLPSEPAFQNNPELRETLSRQTQDMQQLIDRQLRLARLAGKGPVGRAFLVIEEIPALLDTLRMLHNDKQLVIESDAEAGLCIPVDREDMLELLGNLLDNACKWATGSVFLSIRQEADTLLEVEDDGPGIDDPATQRLLKRGNRLDEMVPGHGLGLAIVKDIVTQYDGTIEVSRSRRLGGCRVSVSLRLHHDPVLSDRQQ